MITAELVRYFLNQKNLKRRLKFQIVWQCAPFLKGLKTASLIAVSDEEAEYIAEVIKGSREENCIRWKKWQVNARGCLILFYREEELKEYLERPACRDILLKTGYPCGSILSVEVLLEVLGTRIEKMRDAENFPHETGIFLGYPAYDVKGFISHSGKEYLFAGYWKVYENPVWARQIFEQYDRVRAYAVNEFLMGEGISEIAENRFVDKIQGPHIL